MAPNKNQSNLAKKRRRIMQENQQETGYTGTRERQGRLVSLFRRYAVKYKEPGGIKSTDLKGKKEE